MYALEHPTLEVQRWHVFVTYLVSRRSIIHTSEYRYKAEADKAPRL